MKGKSITKYNIWINILKNVARYRLSIFFFKSLN